MEHSAGLARLEEFVDNLLNQHAQLRAENLALQRTIHDRESEIRSLKQDVEQLITERDEVGGRVARLLGRIERWQDEQPLSNPAGQGQDPGQLLTGEPD